MIERVAAASELRIADLSRGPSKPGPGSSLLDSDTNGSELKMPTAFFTLPVTGTGAHALDRDESFDRNLFVPQ